MRSQIVVNHSAFVELCKYFSYPRCDLDGLDDLKLSARAVQQRLAAGVVQDHGGVRG
jgi:hypothetical protein